MERAARTGSESAAQRPCPTGPQRDSEEPRLQDGGSFLEGIPFFIRPEEAGFVEKYI